MNELLIKTKTYAVVYVQIGTSDTPDRLVDENLAALKKALDGRLSDYTWRVEDVIDRG